MRPWGPILICPGGPRGWSPTGGKSPPGIAMASLGLPWPGHALHASSGVAGSDLAWVEGRFPSQLGFKSPPKSTPVLTCLDLSCPVLSCSVLSWLLTPNLDTPNHENHCFSRGKTKFFEKSFFDINIDFVSILEPTWPCFAPQNRPKSVQKSIPTCNKILIDFGIDLGSDSFRHFLTIFVT